MTRQRAWSGRLTRRCAMERRHLSRVLYLLSEAVKDTALGETEEAIASIVAGYLRWAADIALREEAATVFASRPFEVAMRGMQVLLDLHSEAEWWWNSYQNCRLLEIRDALVALRDDLEGRRSNEGDEPAYEIFEEEYVELREELDEEVAAEGAA